MRAPRNVARVRFAPDRSASSRRTPDRSTPVRSEPSNDTKDQSPPSTRIGVSVQDEKPEPTSLQPRRAAAKNDVRRKVHRANTVLR
jgi:hypothetical protein